MIVKLKHIANLCGNAVKEFDGTKRYYSTGNINTENYELVTYKNRPSRANVVVKENDILIAKMKNTNKTTIANKEMENNIFSTGFSVLESKGINNKYLYYLLESPEFIEKKDVFSVGTTQVSINDETLKNIEINYVEDIECQNKIVNYLDKKILAIDNVVEKTKETIEDYKKYKQRIITKTISNGIYSNVEKKEYNRDNLKSIPVHWKMCPLKYYVDLNKETLSEKTDNEYEFRYAEIGSVTLEEGVQGYENYKFKNAPSRARRIVKNGDIIVSTVRTYLKAVAVIDDANDVIVSTGFAVLSPKKINSNYLGWVIKSDYFTDLVSSRSTGISYPAITSSDLINFKIPVPPIDEQWKISEYISSKCENVDNLIRSKEKIIEELEQYKKSVIYEYVTGKKEVK